MWGPDEGGDDEEGYDFEEKRVTREDQQGD
jgi:hypothetical protein